MSTILEFGLTPQRKLTITVSGGAADIEVTQLLGTGAVVFEEEINKLDVLRFSIVHEAATMAALIDIGDVVRFDGGYRADVAGDGTPTRLFFIGYVNEVAPKFMANGRVALGVVASDIRYRLTRNKPGPLAYPAPKYDGELYPRAFRVGTKGSDGKSTLKLSEIVRGILDEHKIPIGEFAIKPEFDERRLTYLDTVVQNADETDFQFIVRLLTGEGQSRFTGVGKDERRSVNLNAIWFMEADPVTEEAKVYIADEGTVTAQTSGIQFIWQGAGFAKVPHAEYDPTAPDAKIIAREIDIRQNLEVARNRVVRYRKDVQAGAIGPAGRKPADWAGQPLVRGEEVAHADPLTPDEFGFLDNSVNPGEFPDGVNPDGLVTPPAAPAGGDVTSVRVEKYAQFMKPREVRYEASSREIPGAVPLPSSPPAAPPAAHSLPPDAPMTRRPEAAAQVTRPLGERIQKFGFQLSMTCPGNIFMQARRKYEVTLPIARYSGTWFCHRCVHEIGLRYSMRVELGR